MSLADFSASSRDLVFNKKLDGCPRSAAEGLWISFDAVHARSLPRDGSWADVPPQYIQHTPLFFCGPRFFHNQAWEDEIMTDGYTFWTTI